MRRELKPEVTRSKIQRLVLIWKLNYQSVVCVISC